MVSSSPRRSSRRQRSRSPHHAYGYGNGVGAGEHGQSIFIERQASYHRHNTNGNMKNQNNLPKLLRPQSSNSLRSYGSSGDFLPLLAEQKPYGSLSSSSHLKPNHYNPTTSNIISNNIKTIRFQIVVWYIGKLDVVTGSLPMTFRVTLFWNDDSQPSNRQDSSSDHLDNEEEEEDDDDDDDTKSCSTNLTSATTASSSLNVWKMAGRQKAFQQEIHNVPEENAIPVPALSILNVATFEMIDAPEVDMLRSESRLMRWTCMYRATVVQDQLRVDEFPHDKHDISLHFAILNGRRKGQQWDRRIWKLALANADDTQHSTRIPYGLVVDQVRMPDFQYNKERGLEFQFSPLNHGLFDITTTSTASKDTTKSVVDDSDMFLKVSLAVLRDSGYYDKNIVPLLALLNVVAVSVLTMEDTDFFQRGLLTMNIAFVEIGIRMTADSHLPSVGYEIRLQRILNEFFFVLMLLVLEANFVYVLREYHNVSIFFCKCIDWMMGIGALLHNAITVICYYNSKRRARNSLHYGWKDEVMVKT